MIGRIFPAQFDNDYRGHWLAIWLLGFLVLSKLFMGLNVAGLNPWVSSEYVLKNADAIPVETFNADVQSLVLFLFSAWGLALFVLSLLGLLVLVRYRAMIPLMYLLLAIEQIGRKVLATAHPITRAVEPGAISTGVLINWGFTAALVVGLLLSLAPSRSSRA
jgi:hypothetical protein